MEFVILDLEWNGTYSKRKSGFFNEIIEFGAVKVNDRLCVEDTFSVVVKPQIGKKLSSKVKNLTNISSEELGLGVTYTRAVSKFKKFLGNAVLMTWGTSEYLQPDGKPSILLGHGPLGLHRGLCQSAKLLRTARVL